MIELLHVIETLGSGGAERLLHTNLLHLDRERFRSAVVTVRDQGDHWRKPIEALGVSVESLGARSRFDWPRAVLRLKRRLERRKVDLLHSHLFEANVIGRLAGRLAGVPVVSSIHNPDYEPEVWRMGEQGPAAKRWFFLGVDRATARLGCGSLIAVSEFVRRSAATHLRVPLERIELVENPIDLDEIRRPPGHDRDQLLGEVGLEGGDRILLNVGRLSPQKGLQHAIDALPAILEAHPRAHLVSLGSLGNKDWVGALERRAEGIGVRERVHFVGARRDVPDWLRACDSFLFPSLFEGMGIALVEAMASGAVAVASSVGPIPDLVRDGVDGILVPPADAEALARAVIGVLSDPERSECLGRAAEASAVVRFDPRKAARRLETIYEKMVEKG